MEARQQDSDRLGIVPRGTRDVGLVAKDAEIATDSDCRRLPRKRGRQSAIGRGLGDLGFLLPRARLIVAREAGSDDNQLSLADLRLLRLNNRRRGR